MRGTVKIIFSSRQQIEVSVDVEPAPEATRAARAWFDQEWARLGCEPLRPSGKVLLLDKILGVADAQGHGVLGQDEAAADFARHAVLALERQHITVDLPGLVVGY
jgi:histidinol-phosphate/aromatic aminotransferase/cobyric acid decarboxylase-like protein